MYIDKNLESLLIITFATFLVTIYFYLSIPSLLEFFTGEKTLRERIIILEEHIQDLEARVSKFDL